MIIDSHTHVISRAIERYPLRTIARSAETSWYLDHGCAADELLDLQRAAGVSGTIFVQSFAAHGFDNAYVCDAAHDHPQARAVGAIDVSDTAQCLLTMELLDERKLSGVRIFDFDGDARGALRDPGLVTLVERCAELQLPVLLMVTNAKLDEVARLAVAVPEARLVLDHGSIPAEKDRRWVTTAPLFALAELGNIVLKITSMSFEQSPRGSAADWVLELAGRFGAARLMWGSDYPHSHYLAYSGLVQLARDAARGLAAEDQARFLGGTALELWPELLSGSDFQSTD